MKKVLIKNEYDMIIELRTIYGADCIIKIVHALPSFNRLLDGPMTKQFIKKSLFFEFFPVDITVNYLVHREEFSRVFLIYRHFT